MNLAPNSDNSLSVTSQFPPVSNPHFMRENPQDILYSTVYVIKEQFSISGGFLNNFSSQRQLSEGTNKLPRGFQEGVFYFLYK
jgi:hypothetical protein